VIPVLTPDEMGGVDRAAPEPVEVLAGRAGRAVALAARRMLHHSYGSRVLVVAGKGNNGADGRAAARVLRGSGVHVRVIDAAELGPGQLLPPSDLVIDAAYGSGISRGYQAPDPGTTPVLAVDIASGLSGVTGELVTDPDGEGSDLGTDGDGGRTAVRAAATVTFAALKPGHLLGQGPERCGPVEVADIGLGAGVSSVARAWLVTDQDVRDLLPGRPREAHKWQSAVAVVAGSPGMTGAP
jgi:NAD(P)H-hydrate repair Nnr-like enzyme with NAD(P)H-hydrate epimerase domain